MKACMRGHSILLYLIGVVKVFSPKPGEMWGWYGVQLVEKVLEQGSGIP